MLRIKLYALKCIREKTKLKQLCIVKLEETRRFTTKTSKEKMSNGENVEK